MLIPRWLLLILVLTVIFCFSTAVMLADGENAIPAWEDCFISEVYTWK